MTSIINAAKRNDFTILLLFRVFQAFLSLASIKILSYYLEPTLLGNYYLILSLVAYCSFIFINPIGTFFNRNLYELRDSGGLRYFLNRYSLYIFTVALSSSLLFLLFKSKLSALADTDSNQLAIFIFIYLLFYTLFFTLVPSFNVFNNRILFIKYSLISQVTGFVLGIFALYFFKSPLPWLYCQVLPYIFLLYWVHKDFSIYFKSAASFPKIKLRDIWTFSAPIALSTFFIWFIGQGYRFPIESRSSKEVIAYLGLGIGIAAGLFSMLETLLNQHSSPNFYRDISSQDSVKRRIGWLTYFESCLYFYIPALFFIIGNSKALANVMVSQQYADVWKIVVLASVVEFLRVSTNLVNMLSHSERKTSVAIIPYITASIVLLILLLTQNLTMTSIPMFLILTNLTILMLFSYRLRLFQSELRFGVYFFHTLKFAPLAAIVFLFDVPNIWQSFLCFAISGVYACLIFFRYKNKVLKFSLTFD
jgi:O-antigen/teichoic acid export membrane protein